MAKDTKRERLIPGALVECQACEYYMVVEAPDKAVLTWIVDQAIGMFIKSDSTQREGWNSVRSIVLVDDKPISIANHFLAMYREGY